MKDSEKDLIIARYNMRFQEFGHDPKTLGWPKRRHFLRYEILLSQWNLKGASILDFGCGFGDMFGYARAKGIECDYEGTDINPTLVDEGRRQYPGIKLFLGDALKDGLPRKYDFIFSSGVHNLKLSDNWGLIKDTFKLFANHARKGFALNFLSNRVEYELEETFHTDPAKVVDLAYTYSNRIVLRNDYMPFDFALFVDMRKEFDKAVAVYPEFTSFIPGYKDP